MEDQPEADDVTPFAIIPKKDVPNSKKKKTLDSEVSMWVQRLEHDRLHLADFLIEDLIERRKLRSELSELERYSRNLSPNSLKKNRIEKPVKKDETRRISNEEDMKDQMQKISTASDFQM